MYSLSKSGIAVVYLGFVSCVYLVIPQDRCWALFYQEVLKVAETGCAKNLRHLSHVCTVRNIFLVAVWIQMSCAPSRTRRWFKRVVK